MKTQMIRADKVMTQQLTTTAPNTHVVDAIEKLIGREVSGLPVIDSERQLLGRFTERSAVRVLDLTNADADSRIRQQLNHVTAASLVKRNSLVLNSTDNVFDSIQRLVAHHFSGAGVVNDQQELLGVFSEASAMHIFIGLCWEQLPSSNVTAWLDRHDDRRIGLQTSLDVILQRFNNRPYRRLMVIHHGKFIGHVSRRDALKAALKISRGPLAASRNLQGELQMGLQTRVEAWMEIDLAVLQENADVLRIARVFLESGLRQLPVIRNNRLIGQISRSDLLRAVQQSFVMTAPIKQGAQPLYLSSTNRERPESLA
ncbi:MAG: CBS domain-containing protein [Fuerstiella sp.]